MASGSTQTATVKPPVSHRPVPTKLMVCTFTGTNPDVLVATGRTLEGRVLEAHSS